MSLFTTASNKGNKKKYLVSARFCSQDYLFINNLSNSGVMLERKRDMIKHLDNLSSLSCIKLINNLIQYGK